MMMVSWFLLGSEVYEIGFWFGGGGVGFWLWVLRRGVWFDIFDVGVSLVDDWDEECFMLIE